MSVSFDTVQIGDELPPLSIPPVNRSMLALFAGASRDHNAIHRDVDLARRAGMPDVFAQGMLGMAWLARRLTGWAPQSTLRRLDVRFMGITHLGNAMKCGGRDIKVGMNPELLATLERSIPLARGDPPDEAARR
jgi:acyl dehydratase